MIEASEARDLKNTYKFKASFIISRSDTKVLKTIWENGY